MTWASTPAAAGIVAVARETLPPEVAATWAVLLRPALRLRRAEPDEQPVAWLGGSPSLPDDVPWPVSDSGRPLGFVAGIDLGRLAVGQVDLPLPGDGTLLFFYRDPGEDVHEEHSPLPDLEPPADRVLYVAAGVATTVRTAPPGAAVYRGVPMAHEGIVTGPDWEHPALTQAVAGLPADDRAFMADPSASDPFRMEMGEQSELPLHRIGGYADPVQGSVEMAVAHQRLARHGRVSWPDPAVLAEAGQWTSLLQIDSDDDAGMMWGDCGSLYWLMRPADLAARRFEAAAFTFQCS